MHADTFTRGSEQQTPPVDSAPAPDVVVAEPAEACLDALVAHGVEYLFLNPGTDTFPIQEAAAKLRALRRAVPRVLLCPFETVALAAFWAAESGGAPILTVILNNGGYNATRQPLLAAYPDGHSSRAARPIGTDLDPSPRYDRLAATVDAYGERVEDPGDALPALRRGLDRVQTGQSAILDIVMARPR